jgi:predicted permease
MVWAQRLWLRLQTLFHRYRFAQRLDDEIQFHLDQQIAENIAAGMSREEARYAAVRTFGNPTALKEETRETWGWIWLEQFARDLRYVVRTLRRAPGFTLAVILVMALGIGANTALFTIVRSVLLKPLPFGDAKRLVMLYEVTGEGKYPYNVVAGGIFEAWQKEAQSFEQVAIWGGNGYTLSGGGGQLPEQLQGTLCSWNLFAILGVQPALGRGFEPSDDRPDANATVILSWGIWKRRFAGDPAILGKSIHLDAKSYTVIGVMPSWFVYPDADTQLWTAIYHDAPPQVMKDLDNHNFLVVGLLKPGATMAQGLKEADTIVKRIRDQYPFLAAIGRGANARWLFDDVVGDYRTPLYVLLAATGCVLLIACLNVANLLVARSAVRRKELAIRSALGGSRWRLIREEVMESLVLSAAGGAIGLVLASAALEWVIRTRQDMARVDTIHVDTVVLLFAAGTTLLSGTFAGAVSAFSSGDAQGSNALRESSRTHSGGQGKARLRKVLLSVEIGLTVVLLIAAGLLLKSYKTLRTVDLGCITQNVLTMHLALPDARYHTPVQRAEFFERLIADVRRLPGVQKTGLVTVLPGDGYGGDSLITIVEHPPLAKGEMQDALRRAAEPGYFDAMGIPLLRGRTFFEGERLERATSVIVSDLFVRTFLPGEDPIGKHVRVNVDGMGPKDYGIVGVVGDSRAVISRLPQPMMYFPLYKGVFERAALAVRSPQDAITMALPIQKLIAQIDEDLAVFHILTMDRVVGRSTMDASFNAELTLTFAVLSLVLASVGLYGVLSYLVAQRTNEIGVRMALGAQRDQVLRLTLADGLRPAALGLVLGLAGGVAAAKIIRDLLYGVQPLDASVFVAVAMIVLGVASAACLIPAWRASRLDPMVALRGE